MPGHNVDKMLDFYSRFFVSAKTSSTPAQTAMGIQNFCIAAKIALMPYGMAYEVSLKKAEETKNPTHTRNVLIGWSVIPVLPVLTAIAVALVLVAALILALASPLVFGVAAARDSTFCKPKSYGV